MKSLRVLFVDDDPAITFVVTALLQRLGHSVTCASSACKALEVARAERPDWIITDRHLPGSLMGDALITQLLTFYPGINAILISGDFEGMKPGKVGDATVTLMGKPFRSKDLAAALLSSRE